MKIEALMKKTQTILPLLACPLCGSEFRTEGGSLVCGNSHCFDAGKKGYFNFATGHDQSAEKYRAELFDCRAKVFRDGFYLPVANAIRDTVRGQFGEEPFALLDAGCGEGYYSRVLTEAFPRASIIGLDISRDAVVQAAGASSSVHWLVADLKHMPVADHSIDMILDVLTPSDYEAFKRVLKPGGTFLKVIPGNGYLREIRTAVAEHLRDAGSFDNTRVIEHLKAHADILGQKTIFRSYPLNEDQSSAFLRMTPMTFSVPEEVLREISLPRITVEMELLHCRIKE